MKSLSMTVIMTGLRSSLSGPVVQALGEQPEAKHRRGSPDSLGRALIPGFFLVVQLPDLI